MEKYKIKEAERLCQRVVFWILKTEIYSQYFYFILKTFYLSSVDLMGHGTCLIIWEMEQKKRHYEWTDDEVQAQESGRIPDELNRTRQRRFIKSSKEIIES